MSSNKPIVGVVVPLSGRPPVGEREWGRVKVEALRKLEARNKAQSEYEEFLVEMAAMVFDEVRGLPEAQAHAAVVQALAIAWSDYTIEQGRELMRVTVGKVREAAAAKGVSKP